MIERRKFFGHVAALAAIAFGSKGVKGAASRRPLGSRDSGHCPKCGLFAEAKYQFPGDDYLGLQFRRCEPCKIFTVIGSGEWMPLVSERDPDFASKIEATKARVKALDSRIEVTLSELHRHVCASLPRDWDRLEWQIGRSLDAEIKALRRADGAPVYSEQNGTGMLLGWPVTWEEGCGIRFSVPSVTTCSGF